MGKKGKIGKQRKDRFYHLAKETGFRSRAAFKLIQLNRKFEFLQKSRVTIDLCAAPGGWLQVCQKYMPVSSVIVGVDLDSIKAIPNVITLQEDITTASCRSALKRELKTWKADLVLNDGAPNVGKSWTHDAFQQNCLTLSALELACEFLVSGGTFVTKVFRSKDYNALIWVLGKLFKKVNATKPAASRNESAEIFIVAQHYLAPDKIDPKFFNPTYLFDEAENEEAQSKKKKVDLLKPASKQKKAKAEGYEDSGVSHFFSFKASQFIHEQNHLELLSKAHELSFDDKEIERHPLTTQEIKECCKDIKVLGRKEILSLIRWRKKMRTELGLVKKKDSKEDKPDNLEEEEADDSADEVDEETRRLRKQKKKTEKARRKLEERLKLKMVIKNDQLVEEDDHELFSLKKLRSNKVIKDFEEFSMSEDSEDERENNERQKRYSRYSKDEVREDIDDSEDEQHSDNDNDGNFGASDDEKPSKKKAGKKASQGVSSNGVVSFGSDDEEDTGLIRDFTPKDKKTEMFFKKGLLSQFLDDADVSDDEEIVNALKELEENKKSKLDKTKRKYEESDDDDDDDDDDLSDFDEPEKKRHPKCQDDIKLDPESLALAEKMITSSKMKRDIMDDAWNRYTRGDEEDAPSWFRKDEEKYWRKAADVDPEALRRYRDQRKELNVRPIKKVAEAKARKKKRALLRLERAKKKAEAITEAPDMSEKEKSAHLRSLYKKSMAANKKKDVTYVVAKKGSAKARPPGVKGRYKVVDRRMKKDNMKKKREEKQKGKKRGHKATNKRK